MNKERLLLLVLGLFVHAFSILQYFDRQYHHILPELWTHSYLTTIIAFYILFVLLLFWNEPHFQISALSLRIGITLILMLPGRDNLSTLGFLIGLTVFECFIYFGKGVGWLVTLGYVGFEVGFSQMSLTLWSAPIAKGRPSEVLELILITLILAIASHGWLSQKKRIHQVCAENESLQASNDTLVLTNANLQAMIIQEQHNAVLEERRNIARDLHDTMACTLVNSLSLLDAYRITQKMNDDLQSSIGEASRLIRQCFVDIRKLLFELRQEDVAKRKNGLKDIQYIIDVFRKAAGIDILLSYNDVPLFPGSEISKVLYRVVQEGLANAVRHGKASRVFVIFHQYHGGIQLTIQDNGLGTDQIQNGFGLLGIAERVKVLQGTVFTQSEPGHGFLLRVWIPYQY